MAWQTGTTGPSTIARTKTQFPWGPLNLPFVTFFCHFPLSKYPPVSLGFIHWPSVWFWYPPSPCIPLFPLRFFPIRSVDTPLSPHVLIFTICINSISSYSCCWIHNQVDKFLFPFKRFSSLHIVGFWPFWFYLPLLILIRHSFGNLLISISDQPVFILHWDLVMMIFLSLLLIECI